MASFQSDVNFYVLLKISRLLFKEDLKKKLGNYFLCRHSCLTLLLVTFLLAVGSNSYSKTVI